VSKDDEEPISRLEGFSADVGWLNSLGNDGRKLARGMLDSFSSCSMFMKAAIEKEDAAVHDEANALMHVVHMILDASFRMAQIETAKAGDLGLDLQIVQNVQQSLISAMVLAGIRYGQENPSALMGGPITQMLDALVQEVMRSLTEEGGEAEDQTEQDD
jgi:hypothetical protein